MPDGLRARIVAALEECRVLIPDAQADAVMAVVQPALDTLKTDRDRWRRDFLNNSVQRGEIMYAQHERDAAFTANAHLVQQRDDAERTLADAVANVRGLMLAAEKLVLDWPNPGTPEHRQAVAEAVHAAERQLARVPAADRDGR